MPEVRQGQIGPAVNRNCEMGISSRAWIDVGATWAEWMCRPKISATQSDSKGGLRHFPLMKGEEIRLASRTSL